MKRKQVPQFINQNWVPESLKNLIREFLDWFVVKVGATRPFVPIIESGLQHTESHHIINLKQSIGAGFSTVANLLPENPSVEHISPDEFKADQVGLYLIINSFHQFNPDQARNILTKIASTGQPVVIVEGNNDSLWQIVGMTVFVPLTVLLASIFVRPFRFSRLFFTYLIPVLPFMIMLDGCLALLKLYAPADLNELCESIDIKNYAWQSGKRDNGRGGKIIYLIGHAAL